MAILIIMVYGCETVYGQDEILKDSGAVSNHEGTTTISGYIDAYYTYDLNSPPGKNIQYAYNYSRNNEFNINLAILSAKYNSDKVRGTVSLQTGTFAAATYAAEPVLARSIAEAYAGYKILNKTWLDAGIFSSHFGFESATSNANWTLTRSLSSENTPYYEAGLRLTYEANDRWIFYAFLLNGWQNIMETTSGKAIGTEIQYKPNAKTLINWSSYVGSGSPDSMGGTRIFNDFYATFKFTKRLKLAALFDFGFQKNANATDFHCWYNPGVVLRYELTDHTSLTGRCEYYNDPYKIIVSTTTPNGFRTLGTSVNFDYKPARNFLLRLEAKYYYSPGNIFSENRIISGNQSVIITSDMIMSF